MFLPNRRIFYGAEIPWTETGHIDLAHHVFPTNECRFSHHSVGFETSRFGIDISI